MPEKCIRVEIDAVGRMLIAWLRKAPPALADRLRARLREALADRKSQISKLKAMNSKLKTRKET